MTSNDTLSFKRGLDFNLIENKPWFNLSSVSLSNTLTIYPAESLSKFDWRHMVAIFMALFWLLFHPHLICKNCDTFSP